MVGQQPVESPQVRHWDLDTADDRVLSFRGCGCGCRAVFVGQTPRVFGDQLRGESGPVNQLSDDRVDPRRRVLHQQLQDADVVPVPGARAVQGSQGRPQLSEGFGQVPVPHRRHVIQPCRLALQRRHEVQGIEDRCMAPMAAAVFGHDLPAVDDRHPIDVRLDRHRRECRRPRHAIAVGLEHHRLALVHQAGAFDAGVQAMRRQRQRVRLFQLKVLPDRQRLARHDPVPLGQAECQELAVQVLQVPGRFKGDIHSCETRAPGWRPPSSS
jgi:hypothetical protein